MGMVYPLSFCGSGGKYLKLTGTPSSNRRLSGAVGRYRIGLLTRFQGHHSASDRCLRHITVLANFIGSMMAMWLSLHSSYKKKKRIHLPSSSSRGRLYLYHICGGQHPDYQLKTTRPDLKSRTRTRLKAFILHDLSATTQKFKSLRLDGC